MNYQMNFVHELDISWILALWFAIHGGDPGPESGVLEVNEETYSLAHALVENLMATYRPYGVHALTNAELEARLVKLGVHPGSPSGGGTSGSGTTGGGATGDGPAGPDTGPGGITVGSSCWHTSARQIRCWKIDLQVN